MTKEWDNLTTKDKIKQAKELIKKIANSMENDPNVEIRILKSIICNAIQSLFHYINDPNDSEISWENPAVDLHYDVDIDKNLRPVYFKFDKNDTLNKEIFIEKIASVFVNLSNILLFEFICDGTIILEQNDCRSYVISSQEINNQIDHINNPDEKLNKIIELTHCKFDTPFEISKFNGEKTACKLIIEFTPLIIDVERHTAHYSIITKLVSNKNLKSFSDEEKAIIKERLIKSFEELPLSAAIAEKTPEGFFEMGFTGKLLIDKALKPDFIGGNTLKISTNNLQQQEMPQKKLTFNKSSVKLSEDEEKFLFLYAVEGVENYLKIAEKMFCSEQTVKNKAQNIQLKLGANSMAHATYLYFMGDALHAD